MSNTNITIGGSFSSIFIVFLILKLVGVISWSWWYVTLPLWIGVAILLAILLICLLALTVIGIVYLIWIGIKWIVGYR